MWALYPFCQPTSRVSCVTEVLSPSSVIAVRDALHLANCAYSQQAGCVDVRCKFWNANVSVDGCLIYIYFERWAVISFNGRFTMMSTMKTHYALLMKTRVLFCKCDRMITQISFRLTLVELHNYDCDLLQRIQYICCIYVLQSSFKFKLQPKMSILISTLFLFCAWFMFV